MGDGYRPVTDSTGTVEVDGLRQLIRSLRRAGDDLADLKDANQAAATIALRGAESLVPYGTGKLAASGRTAKQAGHMRHRERCLDHDHLHHPGVRHADPGRDG
jgi:hypothetical protein